MVEIVEFLSDWNMAVLGLVTVVAILIAWLFEKYLPLEPAKPPKITDDDDPNMKRPREELIRLSTRNKDLPMITLAQLSENSGAEGQMAWVCNKGIIYDVSSNEVYRSQGGYNCFSGKDATLSLGKM